MIAAIDIYLVVCVQIVNGIYLGLLYHHDRRCVLFEVIYFCKDDIYYRMALKWA